ncbi:MAG: hypothetical protein CSB33_01300 [Desulfobacterales bacterium]|nr:MAG: hypothetical protein CSB33_01300 [Desulfobacterales bacterium]
MSKKGEKSVVQMIVESLMTGQKLKSKELAAMVSDIAGREVKMQDIASMLSKISSPKKCALGYFVKRVREKGSNSYNYELARELLDLPPEKVYGLSLKTGPYKYTLAQAVEEYPQLKDLIPEGAEKPPEKGTRKQRKTGKKPGRKPAVPAPKVVNLTSRKKDTAEDAFDETDEELDVESLAAAAEFIEGISNFLQNINININITVKLENN